LTPIISIIYLSSCMDRGFGDDWPKGLYLYSTLLSLMRKIFQSPWKSPITLEP